MKTCGYWAYAGVMDLKIPRALAKFSLWPDAGSDAWNLRSKRSFGTANRKEDAMRRTDFSTIIPSLAPQAEDVALDRLFSPSRHYRHPDDVLRDGTLDRNEKRAILSSWASDACAIESMPALRQLPGAEQPVAFDGIMDALRSLDRAAASEGKGLREVAGERHRLDA